jgi:hypothetical protein
MIRFTGVRRMALLLTVFVALLLAGCAPSVVGKWEGSMAGTNGSLEFKPDGKFEQNFTVPMLPMVGTLSATGTYKVEGDKLSTKTADVMAGGKSIKALMPPQLSKQLDQNVTFKVEGDKLTLDSGKGTATLTRVKP